MTIVFHVFLDFLTKLAANPLVLQGLDQAVTGSHDALESRWCDDRLSSNRLRHRRLSSGPESVAVVGFVLFDGKNTVIVCEDAQ